MGIANEKTFLGKGIKTPEDFIEDMCDRLNKVYNTIIEEEGRLIFY